MDDRRRDGERLVLGHGGNEYSTGIAAFRRVIVRSLLVRYGHIRISARMAMARKIAARRRNSRCLGIVILFTANSADLIVVEVLISVLCMDDQA